MIRHVLTVADGATRAGFLLVLLLLIALLAMVFPALYARQTRKTAGIVRRWAELNGFTILEMKRTFLDSGPFFCVSNVQAVFRVTITDGQGKTRRAWIRTGGWLSPRPTVKWDEGTSQ